MDNSSISRDILFNDDFPYSEIYENHLVCPPYLDQQMFCEDPPFNAIENIEQQSPSNPLLGIAERNEAPTEKLLDPEIIKDKTEKGFKCSLCSKHFVQKSSCNRHMREQHLQPESFQCNACGLRFSNKFNLKTHQVRAHSKHLENTNESFKCPHCTCIYSTKSVLKKHIHDYHKQQQLKDSQAEEPDDNDPQSVAEKVLKELKLMQQQLNGIETASNKITEDAVQSNCDNTSSVVELTTIDKAIVENITLKDRLYPYGAAKELNVQSIIRSDGTRYYICEFCSKEFRKSYGYLRHRRIHSRIRPFICVVCKKPFPTQNQLKRHCSTHKPDGRYGIIKGCYKCPKCLDTMPTIAEFDRHLGSHLPNTIITFNCRQCTKSFNLLSKFSRHKHKPVDPELDMLKSLLPSPLCLVDGIDVSANIVTNNFATTKDFQCSLCGLKMSSHVALLQHEQRHRNLRKYQCYICKGFYATKSSLKVHTKLHLNLRKHKCNVCYRGFATSFQLKRHELKHATLKQYKCRYCNKSFKTTQYCRSHMMTHLKELIKTNVEAQQRNEYAVSIQTLIENTDSAEILITEVNVLRKPRLHKLSQPKAENKSLDFPHKCLKCQQRFRHRCWLNRHIVQTHTEDRPFKCEICLKSFRNNQVLKTHLLTHEETRSKVVCVVCGKQYTSSKSLKVHLRLHTDEKPFQCEICEKRFRTSGHLIQHRKSNHKENQLT